MKNGAPYVFHKNMVCLNVVPCLKEINEEKKPKAFKQALPSTASKNVLAPFSFRPHSSVYLSDLKGNIMIFQAAQFEFSVAFYYMEALKKLCLIVVLAAATL